MNRLQHALAASLIVNMTITSLSGAIVFAQMDTSNTGKRADKMVQYVPEFKKEWEEIDELLKKEEHQVALKKANVLVTRFPKKGPAFFKRAQVYAAMSKPAQGMADIQKSMELGPVTSATYAVRSRLYYEQNKFKEALADIDKALEINPEKKLARVWRISVLEKLGRPKDAQNEANSAAEAHPASYKVVMKAARLEKKSNPKLAIEHLNQAIKISPQDPEPWRLMAEIRMATKDYLQATRAFDRAIELDPKNAELYYHRARVKKATLMAQDAIKDCDRAILNDKSKSNYYRLRSELNAQIGHFEEALVDANKAISIDPRNVENRSAKAEVLMQTEKFDECIKECTAGLAISPDCAPLLINRGEAHEKINKKALALKDFKKASEVAKMSFRNLVRKGTLETQLGFHEEAIKTYTAAISKAKSTAKSRAYIERADIYDKLGKVDEAKADRRQAKELSSGLMDDVLGEK